jgi:acyl-coenzyme A synthetase/AMP-(fatty) acid ligase
MNPPTSIIAGNMHCPKLPESLDDVAFVAEIPPTTTGKILKTALRETFKDFVLPSVAA